METSELIFAILQWLDDLRQMCIWESNISSADLVRRIAELSVTSTSSPSSAETSYETVLQIDLELMLLMKAIPDRMRVDQKKEIASSQGKEQRKRWPWLQIQGFHVCLIKDLILYTHSLHTLTLLEE